MYISKYKTYGNDQFKAKKTLYLLIILSCFWPDDFYFTTWGSRSPSSLVEVVLTLEHYSADNSQQHGNHLGVFKSFELRN